MSKLAAKRALSWIACAAVAAAAAWACARLPGSDGAIGEVRWLLRDRPSRLQWNRAHAMLHLRPLCDDLPATYARLMSDANESVQLNSLRLLTDELAGRFARSPSPHSVLNEPLLAVLDHWLRELDAQRRAAFRTAIVTSLKRVFGQGPGGPGIPERYAEWLGPTTQPATSSEAK